MTARNQDSARSESARSESTRSESARFPLSRLVDTKRVSDGGLDFTVTATEAECAALAAFLGIVAIRSLSGSFLLRRRAGGRFAVTGRVQAEVVQNCVVTLEDFDATLEQPVEVAFEPADRTTHRKDSLSRYREELEDKAASDGAAIDINGEDPPDPMIGDSIDLGQTTAEFLALALDPYPKKPGVQFADRVEPEDEHGTSAFAALASLKGRV